jgi:hypothetical protein
MTLLLNARFLRSIYLPAGVAHGLVCVQLDHIAASATGGERDASAPHDVMRAGGLWPARRIMVLPVRGDCLG